MFSVSRKRVHWERLGYRRAGYGFEVQMDYTFYGNDRAIKWAQKLITLIMKDKDSISKNIIK